MRDLAQVLSKEHTKGTKIGTSDSFLNFVRVVVTTQ